MKTLPVKSVILSFLFGLICPQAITSEVDSTKALIVAKNFAYFKFAHAKSQSPEETHPRIEHVLMGKEDKPLLYFVNVKPEGYLIVSGDDQCSPVLAYSKSGHWNHSEWSNMPDGLRGFISSYAEQIEIIRDNNLKGSDLISTMWSKALTSSDLADKKGSDRLLTRLSKLSWSQLSPYNDLAPVTGGIHPIDNNFPYYIFFGGKTPAGCVAVAMAQIMKYWHWPHYGNSSNSYTDPDNAATSTYLFDPSYGVQLANFGATSYSWHNMPDMILTPIADISTIIRHAGVAANMDYKYYEASSNITNARNAFVNNFRFSSNAKIEEKRFWISWEEWEAKMVGEIDVGRPFYYRGDQQGTGGHAFICYGYDDENIYPKFVFNWGWDNYNDLWLTVRNLIEGSTGINFPDNHKMISNLFPDGSNIDPCNSPIYHISGIGPQHTKTYMGGGLGAWFTSSNNPSGVKSSGIEQMFSFVAPATGTYSIQVTAADGVVSYMWKEGFCSPTGWNTIANIGSVGSYGSMSMTAGKTYHFLLDDTDIKPGEHTFYIREPVLPPVTELYSGSVTPTSGTDIDSYTFKVFYKSTGGTPPATNSVKVAGYGWEHTLTANGSSWAAGVEFSKTISGFATGNYAYWFTCSSNGVSYRFPKNENLQFTVSQNAVGWDARVTALSANRAYFSGSTNIVAYGTVSNYSNAGNTYYNLPLKFEMLDPGGNRIHESNYTISQLSPGASFEIQTPSINISSSSPNGVYQVRLTIYPNRDSNSANNTRSINIIKGSSANAEHFYIKSINFMKVISAGQTYSFAGYNLLFSTISSNRVSIKDQYNKIYSVNLNDFAEIDQGNYVVLFAANLSSSMGAYHFGTKDPAIITYENTSVSGFPGQQIEFIANSNSSTQLLLASDFNYDPLNVKSWYNSSQSVLFNNNRSIKRYFTIPASTTPGSKVFYFLTGYRTTNEYVMSRLTINVLQPVPVITSLSNYNLSIGATVTITGSNFGSTKGEVKFNHLPATVSAWSNTNITCTVPAGAISGLATVKNNGGTSNGISYEISYSILVNALPSEGGMVSGGGTYKYGSSLSLVASPFPGWDFSGWKENDLTVSYDLTYSFTADRDRTLSAHFSEAVYSISVMANPAAGGIVTGNGTHKYGEQASIYALANEGYKFENWTEGGQIIFSGASQVFTVTSSQTLTANFSDIPRYKMSVSVQGLGNVMVNNNTYTNPLSYFKGTSVNINAKPEEGWTFDSWGGDINSSNPDQFIIIDDNINILASFSVVSFTDLDPFNAPVLYPNPFTNTINIKNADRIQRLTITTMIGVKILDLKPKQQSLIVIPTNFYKDGIYLITLYGDQGIISTKRIVKN